MERQVVFRILDIAETKDKKQIKSAYYAKLAITHPEDNPEGFRRLREAYEEACRLADLPEVEEDVPDLSDEDPLDRWIREADAIYADISKRIDVECWKALFAQDIC
ncbi:MAG: J domain-containing protein, partial [Clostridium sp.]|nr:J domain-containing protein [Clostridium sp.]